MVSEIAIYIEGGGDQRDTKNRLREGFGTFLGELRETARNRGIRWKIVACGSRNEAYSDFCTAVQQNPDAFNMLLVDAEQAITPVSQSLQKQLWTHLKQQDGWDCPPGIDDTNCFLMVQCMEAWLIADRANLQKYYGTCFDDGALPKNPAIESVDKITLCDALQKATRNCSKPYHKTRHAFDILKNADSTRVKRGAPHCKRLFDTLAQHLGGNARTVRRKRER